MKTIHDAATERSIYYESNPYCDFKAGVEFAQQWISVEDDDELPAVGETVLLKFDNNEEHVTTGVYIKSFHGDCAYQESGEQCTHWRPIERK